MKIVMSSMGVALVVKVIFSCVKYVFVSHVHKMFSTYYFYLRPSKSSLNLESFSTNGVTLIVIEI